MLPASAASKAAFFSGRTVTTKRLCDSEKSISSSRAIPLAGTAAGGTLAPTLDLPQYAEGEFCTMSSGLIVKLENAGNVDDTVDYDTTTGQLYARDVSASGGVGTAAVATNVLTVASLPAGSPNIGVGSVITTASGKQGTVTGLGTGTGGNGTYQTVGLPDHAAEAFTYTSVAPTGRANIPGSKVVRYSTTQAGNAVVELNG